MAIATEPRIILETGSNRQGTTMSSRTFFVYVSPTGAEMPLGQCPVLKREYIQNHGKFGTPDFRQTAAYILRGESRLKMVCLSSTFGRPRRVLNLFVDIGTGKDVIEFYGSGECGKFSGRGELDIKSSVLSENKQELELTPQLLKELFGYRILQRGTAREKSGARSLIF